MTCKLCGNTVNKGPFPCPACDDAYCQICCQHATGGIKGTRPSNRFRNQDKRYVRPHRKPTQRPQSQPALF